MFTGPSLDRLFLDLRIAEIRRHGTTRRLDARRERRRSLRRDH